MTTYYVNGALGTDDGSHGTAAGAGAWRTLTYALGVSGVPLTGGPHTVNVAAGTYTEGTDYGLSVSRVYSTMTTVIGDATTPSNVIVQPGTVNRTMAMMLGGVTSNLTMRGIRFRSNGAGGGGSGYLVYSLNTDTNIAYEDCEFVLPAVASLTAFYSAQITTNMSFVRCLFDCDAAANQSGVSLNGSPTVPISGILVQDCAFSCTGIGCALVQATSSVVERVSITTSGSIGFVSGVEGSAALTDTVVRLRDSSIVATASGAHAVLLANGNNRSIVERCMIVGPRSYVGYGLVLKGTDDTIRDCQISGAQDVTVLLKGALREKLERCTLIQGYATGTAVVAVGGGVRGNAGTYMRDCAVVSAPGAKAFSGFAAQHATDDDIRLLGLWGAAGTDLPSNGYGAPVTTLGPGLPTQHKWAVD